MTTNFNHILNENLDMLPGYDFPSNFIELDDGTLVEESYLWFGWDDDDEWEYCEDDDAEIEANLEAYLDELEQEMATIVERCGVYGAEEYAELASIYSDVYKDIYGIRPRW